MTQSVPPVLTSALSLQQELLAYLKKQIGLLVLTSTRLEALTNRYPEKPAYKLYCLTVHHTPSELPNLIEKIIDIAPTYQSAQSSN